MRYYPVLKRNKPLDYKMIEWKLKAILMVGIKPAVKYIHCEAQHYLADSDKIGRE